MSESVEWVNGGRRKKPVIQVISKIEIDKNPLYHAADFLLYETLKL